MSVQFSKTFTDLISVEYTWVKIRAGEVKDGPPQRSLSIQVYRKPAHTGQYLMFNSHHRLELKLGVIRTLNLGLRPFPLSQRGSRRNRSPSGEYFKTVFTETGPQSKPLKDPEQTERRRENVTTSSFPMSQEHLRNSGWSLINMRSLFTLNLPTYQAEICPSKGQNTQA